MFVSAFRLGFRSGFSVGITGGFLGASTLIVALFLVAMMGATPNLSKASNSEVTQPNGITEDAPSSDAGTSFCQGAACYDPPITEGK